MKKNFLNIFLLCVFNTLTIQSFGQMIHIPDPGFRGRLTTLGYGSAITVDSIDSSVPLVAHAFSLTLSAAFITNLQGIQAFTSLRKLVCSNNQLLSIPAVPFTLDSLDISLCSINQLPSLPSTLSWLSIAANNFTTLPILPDSLKVFLCGN